MELMELLTIKSILVMIVIPFICTFVVAKYFFPHDVSYFEWFLSFVACAIIMGVSIYMIRNSNISDTTIYHGRVTDKVKEQVSCSHSYSCGCNSKGTNCRTCYEHFWDYDWIVKVLAGDSVHKIKIDRVNRQGTKEPPRWTAAVVGEPAAVEAEYLNPVLGVPQSLESYDMFKEGSNELGLNFVSPSRDWSKIFDYYRVNRVTSIDVNIPDINIWNQKMGERLKQYGNTFKVSPQVVFVNHGNAFVSKKLEIDWLGGRKNEIVIMFGMEKYPDIKWVRVFSMTGNRLTPVTLESEFLGTKTVDPIETLDRIFKVISETKYVEKDMKELDYLYAALELSTLQIIVLFLMSLVWSFVAPFAIGKLDIGEPIAGSNWKKRKNW